MRLTLGILKGRSRVPADMIVAVWSFGKGGNEFWMMTGKKEVERSLYTRAQAPNARTLQDFLWSKVVVVIIMMYIYCTTMYLSRVPSAIYVYTHPTVETYSCT